MWDIIVHSVCERGWQNQLQIITHCSTALCSILLRTIFILYSNLLFYNVLTAGSTTLLAGGSPRLDVVGATNK